MIAVILQHLQIWRLKMEISFETEAPVTGLLNQGYSWKEGTDELISDFTYHMIILADKEYDEVVGRSQLAFDERKAKEHYLRQVIRKLFKEFFSRQRVSDFYDQRQLEIYEKFHTIEERANA